jgi:hypothetical protein
VNNSIRQPSLIHKIKINKKIKEINQRKDKMSYTDVSTEPCVIEEPKGVMNEAYRIVTMRNGVTIQLAMDESGIEVNEEGECYETVSQLKDAYPDIPEEEIEELSVLHMKVTADILSRDDDPDEHNEVVLAKAISISELIVANYPQQLPELIKLIEENEEKYGTSSVSLQILKFGLWSHNTMKKQEEDGQKMQDTEESKRRRIQ